MTRTAASCALAHLILTASLCPPAASTTVPIPLSASGVAHTFTGNGGLSAGASSRLLQDYPAAIRADVLDMLFLPQHGLGLDIIKVEVRSLLLVTRTRAMNSTTASCCRAALAAFT